MPEEKRPLKVFLCHARADRDAVRGLYARLTDEGVDAWLDEEDLLPGQSWRDVIEESVRTSDIVLVCLSTESVTKEGFVQKEIKIALDVADEKPENTIFVIPARLDDCVVPRRLKDVQWVDLYKEGGYSKLLKALKVRDEQIEKIRIEKDEIVKRRLPTYDSPLTRQNVLEQSLKNGLYENISPHDSSKKSDLPRAVKVPSNKKSKSNPTIKTEYVVATIGAIATIFAALLGSPLIEKWFSSTPVQAVAETVTVTLTQSIPLSKTPEPSKTPTSTPSLPEIITSDPSGSSILMRLVPMGEFVMGNDADSAFVECKKFSNDCDRINFMDEGPTHQVHLDAFYMDKYEVANELYKACVDVGVCKLPTDLSSYSRSWYYGNPDFDNFPVVYVTWSMAKTYCEWRGARLPTEAEWEKALRGQGGDAIAGGMKVNSVNFCDSKCPFQWANQNYDDGYQDTAPVNSYPNVSSPYRIGNLSGNVWEWIEDWYGSNYYLESSNTNPIGPITGEYKVIRGGSFGDLLDYTRITRRSKFDPNKSTSTLGFRCAKDVP